MKQPETLKKYTITIDVIVDSHPRKWLAETISDVLCFEKGEDIVNIEINEINQTDSK